MTFPTIRAAQKALVRHPIPRELAAVLAEEEEELRTNPCLAELRWA
jgi:hypothetical protein